LHFDAVVDYYSEEQEYSAALVGQVEQVGQVEEEVEVGGEAVEN
jgi:hypothetical protein